MTARTRRNFVLGTAAFATASLVLGPRLAAAQTAAPTTAKAPGFDARVQRFLEQRRGTWRDLNIPYRDGKVLHDLIVKDGFTRALEIGTSTGHSAIWIAWALSKTGGRLTTIEIDPARHRTALRNFKEAGVTSYIDARLANAHELVGTLEGPFDFVFSDADKGWYTNYFKAVSPRMTPGGCFTAHNVTDGFSGAARFLEHVRGQSNFTTRIDHTSGAGLSISCKTAG